MPLLHHHFHNMIPHHHFYNMIQTSTHFFLTFPHIAHLLWWLLNQKQNLDWPVVLPVPESSQSSSLFSDKFCIDSSQFTDDFSSYFIQYIMLHWYQYYGHLDTESHNTSFCILFSQLAERCRHFWRPSMFVVLQNENHPDQHQHCHHHHRASSSSSSVAPSSPRSISWLAPTASPFKDHQSSLCLLLSADFLHFRPSFAARCIFATLNVFVLHARSLSSSLLWTHPLKTNLWDEDP